MIIQLQSFLLLLCICSCRATEDQFLRKRQQEDEQGSVVDNPFADASAPGFRLVRDLAGGPPRRDLSEIQECRKSTEMEVPLIPANMKYLLHSNKNKNSLGIGGGGSSTRNDKDNQAAATTRQHPTPSSARLTFCLNRIYLDFNYILDAGTLITDLDIECPHVKAPVHFLSSNYVMPVTPNDHSRFFVNGTYPGEVHVSNEDILRILADGDDCEFKVRAYHFDDGLLVGQLRGDAFQPVK